MYYYKFLKVVYEKIYTIFLSVKIYELTQKFIYLYKLFSQAQK
jgi:hypothetical protein